MNPFKTRLANIVLANGGRGNPFSDTTPPPPAFFKLASFL